MKRLILVLAFVLLPKIAKAGVGDVVPISTVTWCNVSVSTSVATRLDNFNGGCDGLLNYRTDVKLCNPTGNTTINFGFDSTVSTQTANSRRGEELVTGCKEIVARSNITIWGFSQAAAAPQMLVVEQASAQ